MSKFRKKPVVIDAVRWTASDGANGLPSWAIAAIDPDMPVAGGSLRIQTLEGVMRASDGDWLIRGVNGEVYPCKPDIFDKTYEPVDGGAE